MSIEVKIPCGTFDELIDAHNRAVMESTADWVLLLNHDVYLACNPRWYEVLMEGLKWVNKDDTGFVTCVASDRGGHLPQSPDIDKKYIRHPDLSIHEKLAEQLWKKYGSEMVKITGSYHVASFFILINREMFRHIQFRQVRKGLAKMDHDFTERVMKAGYKVYVMPGLYVYHGRSRWQRKRK